MFIRRRKESGKVRKPFNFVGESSASLFSPPIFPYARMRVAALLAAIALAASAKAHSFIARQASNPNNTVSCGLNQLQCCDAVSLASAPIVANALGIEGLAIPDPNEIVGLNCTDIGPIPSDQTIQQVCPSLIACCAQTGLGNDGAVSENCTFPTNIPTSEMFRGPARTNFQHPAPIRRRASWYDGWTGREVWDDDDDDEYGGASGVPQPVHGASSEAGAGATVFAWKGPRVGWVADHSWGMDMPMLFHAPHDDGLPPVDFSLRIARTPVPPSPPPPKSTYVSSPASTGAVPVKRRERWEEDPVQVKRKRRPMKRWKGT